jgi:Putative methyltransferase
MSSEWVDWHAQYAARDGLSRRLEVVRWMIGDHLDRLDSGPSRAVSLCAGDGRDLLDVLARHPVGRSVQARLADLDPALVAAGRERAARAGLDRVQFVCADAGRSDTFRDAVPAELVLACGIFGNVSDDDVRGTIGQLPLLCAPRATVIWTRGRFAPDLTPSIRAWFGDSGFEELEFVPIPDSTMSVGAARYTGPPRAWRPGVRFFTFLPPDRRPSHLADRGSVAPR